MPLASASAKTQCVVVGAAAAALTALLLAGFRRRRSAVVVDIEGIGEDEDETPRALPEPPHAGPHSSQAVQLSRDPLLDAGLEALGMLTGPVQMEPTPRPLPLADELPLPETLAEATMEADETIVVTRVSPEEEERRYFASMAGGGDLFDSSPVRSDAVTK
eukprot:CAMPEP_0194478936 /NCGR_PEP_ID=MMETSP0253-20130528/2221_1 /TAXON_ID=2966 /ORGANISM="Noctiluca scintillans" /LENGTH=160 /DNA_ID=CAMNT_0039318097 /DNA_START=29 /DNA_END=508 /DNA_ORIENTATION=-